MKGNPSYSLYFSEETKLQLLRVFPARLELATFRVLGGRDNHYTTETVPTEDSHAKALLPGQQIPCPKREQDACLQVVIRATINLNSFY